MTLAASITQLIEARQVQQKLRKNPNDIDSLTKLASLIQDDPTLKRSVVNRILALQPENRQARQMLLELDQAEMFSGSVQSVAAVPIVQTSAGTAAPTKAFLEKPQVFNYEILSRLFVYSMLVISLLPILVLVKAEAWPGFVCFGPPVLILLIFCWTVSARLEINTSGISLTHMFGLVRREIDWEEMESIQPYNVGAGLKVTSRQGRSIKFSSRMTRFSAICEILSKMQPRLYSTSKTLIFRKGFFWKYWWFVVLIPATIIFMSTVLVPPFFHAILLGLVMLAWWKMALFGIHSILIEEEKLTAKSFWKKLILTPQQINDISVYLTRNHKGVPKKWVRIELQKGDEILLSNFPGSLETLCASLQNWWNQYRGT